MNQFLLSLIPASLFIYAVHILFQEDHLLEKQGEWMENNWPEKVNKPLWACPICQSSVWGTLWFWLGLQLFNVHHDWQLYIPYVFCLCGLNYIINKLISKDVNVTIE